MSLPLSHYVIAYICAALVFLGLDAVWLSTMADRLYRPAIGHLMAERFTLVPAVLFYLIYLTGVLVFAVAPALERQRPLQALLMGGLLGLLCYATYDLTNQATLRLWPWHVTLADLAWGTFVTGVSAWAATQLTLWWRH